MTESKDTPSANKPTTTTLTKATVSELIRLFAAARDRCDDLPKKKPEIWQRCHAKICRQTSWDDELRSILQVSPAVGAIHARDRSRDSAIRPHDILDRVQRFIAGELSPEDGKYRLWTDAYNEVLEGNVPGFWEGGTIQDLYDPVFYDLALVPYYREDTDYVKDCEHAEDRLLESAKSIDHALDPLLPELRQVPRLSGTLLTANWPAIRKGPAITGKMLYFHDERYFANAIEELELLLTKAHSSPTPPPAPPAEVEPETDSRPNRKSKFAKTAAIAEHLHAHPTASSQEVSKATGIDASDVRRLWGPLKKALKEGKAAKPSGWRDADGNIEAVDESASCGICHDPIREPFECESCKEVIRGECRTCHFTQTHPDEAMP
jgi:hypothetical protein